MISNCFSFDCEVAQTCIHKCTFYTSYKHIFLTADTSYRPPVTYELTYLVALAKWCMLLHSTKVVLERA